MSYRYSKFTFGPTKRERRLRAGGTVYGPNAESAAKWFSRPENQPKPKADPEKEAK